MKAMKYSLLTGLLVLAWSLAAPETASAQGLFIARLVPTDEAPNAMGSATWRSGGGDVRALTLQVSRLIEASRAGFVYVVVYVNATDEYYLYVMPINPNGVGQLTVSNQNQPVPILQRGDFIWLFGDDPYPLYMFGTFSPPE